MHSVTPSSERLGRLLDSVMTIDFGGRGFVNILYKAIRATVDLPLSVNAAEVIRGALSPGTVAMIATGFPVRPWISPAIGETDGPPGAAALARAISLGLNAIPVVTAPIAMVEQVRASLCATGMSILELEEARRAVEGSRSTCAAVVLAREPGPISQADATDLFKIYNPTILAAIEHPGANATGIYNSSVGIDISDGVAASEPLFEEARRRAVPTLSFIDNVNEIGAGGIAPEALRQLAIAARTAGTSRVDHLVVGTTANWAAYATVAALAVLLDREDLLMSRERDAKAIAAVMAAGGVEGVSGSAWPEDGVDAVPSWVSGHIVDLFAHIARSHAVNERRGAF